MKIVFLEFRNREGRKKSNVTEQEYFELIWYALKVVLIEHTE